MNRSNKQRFKDKDTLLKYSTNSNDESITLSRLSPTSLCF